jgi:NTP pyrophosphatase (non-canonical NTP hydrolase)
MIKNIKEKINECYETAKARGKITDDMTIHEIILTGLIEEVGEASRALRKGNRAATNEFFKAQEAFYNCITGMGTGMELYLAQYNMCIKDTLEDELADIAICIMSLAGYLNCSIDIHERLYYPDEQSLKLSNHENFNDIACLSIGVTQKNQDNKKTIDLMIMLPLLISRREGVDINKYIELKMRYNYLITTVEPF